ncbi:MAG: transglutaminase-like domain-containing protein [Clostridia bacterium]|nr:transglutaminase-like domain-containing protein [Clostridia bacterium]
MKKKFIMFLVSVFLLLTFYGCSGNKELNIASLKSSDGTAIFYDSVFCDEHAEEMTYGSIDLSHLNCGYIGVKADSDKRLKFQLSLMGNETYTYDLPGDGSVNIFTFPLGDGMYTLKLRENTGGNEYGTCWTKEIEVQMDTVFEPFIRPNQTVNYSKSSECVKLAETLDNNAEDSISFVSDVYAYLCDNITYDYDKAETVSSGYLPNPDETLRTGKGICYDYAALACAMLRSRDIPCQLIKGYFTDDCIYHAWNRLYIDGSGWLTVEIELSSDVWNRIDITMASAGADSDELVDGTLYTTRSVY